MSSFLDAILGVGPTGASAQRQLNAQTALNAANSIGIAAQGVAGDPLAAQRQARDLFVQQQARTDAMTQQLRFQEDQAQRGRMQKAFGTALQGAGDVGAFFSARNDAATAAQTGALSEANKLGIGSKLDSFVPGGQQAAVQPQQAFLQARSQATAQPVGTTQLGTTNTPAIPQQDVGSGNIPVPAQPQQPQQTSQDPARQALNLGTSALDMAYPGAGTAVNFLQALFARRNA